MMTNIIVFLANLRNEIQNKDGKMWKMSFNIIMDVENDESVKMRTPRKMRELSGHHLAFEIMDVENEKKYKLVCLEHGCK